jgi:Mitochondrial K+-H+ exchange-related
MDVYLIPLGADRYELYCEPRAIAPELEPDAEVQGMMGRLKRYFRDVIAAAEHARKARSSAAASQAPASGETAGIYARTKHRALAWIADKIAEQRLLWALRQQESATLVYPADVSQHEADDIARRILQRDADRHRWWLAIDTVLLLLSAALILLPGPNFIGYYFAFRVVGHYLSWRGARHALDALRWETRSNEDLAHVRDAIDMAPGQRTHLLHDIASRLSLDDLPTFVERCAFRSA